MGEAAHVLILLGSLRCVPLPLTRIRDRSLFRFSVPRNHQSFSVVRGTELVRPCFAGEYGLRNKREVWRVKFTLAKIRKAARELLTLDEKDPRRLFEGVYGKHWASVSS